MLFLLLTACDGGADGAVADDTATPATDDTACTPGFVDADGDGHGGATPATCADPGVASADDCDDADPETYPGALERCDGEDDDCDEEVDEGLGALLYRDADMDGWGVAEESTTACPSTPGWSTSPGDCDDADEEIHPKAEDVCDEVDQDCDGALPTGAIGYLSASGVNHYALANSTLGAGFTIAEPATLYLCEGDFVGTLELNADSRLVGLGTVRFSPPAGETLLLLKEGARFEAQDLALVGTARTYGGVLAMQAGATATLTRVAMSGGAAEYGGGVYVSDGGTLTVVDSTFGDLQASEKGGAVYAQAATLAFTGTRFEGNRAATGGAIALVGGTLVLDGTDLTANTGLDDGGGLYVASGAAGFDVRCTGGSITGNTPVDVLLDMLEADLFVAEGCPVGEVRVNGVESEPGSDFTCRPDGCG